MLSRRTLMKYTGLAWLGSLFKLPDGGSEQLPTNIKGPNPWDAVVSELVEEFQMTPVQCGDLTFEELMLLRTYRKWTTPER